METNRKLSLLALSVMPRRGDHAGGRTRRSRRVVVLGPILLFSFLFYFWTATTEANPITFHAHGDPYSQLTSAFLHGHLSLAARPPKALTALAHPYDPIDNAPFQARFHDLALYHGHIYVTWGPTPVVTLLLPWRLLGLGSMPVNLAAIVFGWLGLLFAVLLLCWLVDRYLPETRPWQLALGAVTLALCNVMPFLLRQPAVYELAVASGYCFAMLGAFLLASGGLGTRRRPWRLALGSLSVGLAAGGRPSLVFEALLLVGLLFYLARNERAAGIRALARLGALLLGPVAVVLGLLLAYNAARFGSPLQIGTQYTIASVNVAQLATVRLSYLGPGLHDYLAAPVRFTYAFPYFTLPTPGAYSPSLPQGEITGGLLTTTPIVAIVLPGLFLLYRQRRGELLAVLGSLVAVGVLVLVFVSVAFWNTTMRYEADFATFLLIPALFVWFALPQMRWRRVVTVVTTLVVVYGCIVGTAISMYGYYDKLRVDEPGTYWSLAQLTSPLPTLATIIAGHPVLARVVVPTLPTNGNGGIDRLGTTRFVLAPGRVLELEIVAPSSGRWTLDPTIRRAGVARGTVSLVVRSGGPAQIVPMSATPRGVILRLSLGLNRVTLQATSSQPDVHGALVVADGLSLSPHQAS